MGVRESNQDLERALELFQAQARMVSNRHSRSVRLDMLMRVEDAVRRTLALLGYRRRIFLLSDLHFEPKHGFWWGSRGGRPATPAEVLQVLPFEQVVQALTHFFETPNWEKGK